MFVVVSMLIKALKHLTALVILLHCIGATQLVSAYSKDKASFVGMINMTEEETKKEKESNDESDTEFLTDLRCKTQELNTFLSFSGQSIYFHDSHRIFTHQFVIESPTPPPDFKA